MRDVPAKLNYCTEPFKFGNSPWKIYYGGQSMHAMKETSEEKLCHTVSIFCSVPFYRVEWVCLCSHVDYSISIIQKVKKSSCREASALFFLPGEKVAREIKGEERAVLTQVYEKRVEVDGRPRQVECFNRRRANLRLGVFTKTHPDIEGPPAPVRYRWYRTLVQCRGKAQKY